MTPAEAIEAADLAEAEIRDRHQLAREMAEAAYERGQVDGYLRAVADVKAIQHDLVRDAELEARRWGPGGRQHFADPRPADYPRPAGTRGAGRTRGGTRTGGKCMTTPEKPAGPGPGPAPCHLGLSIDPAATWEDIGIAEPSPCDLGWASDPGMTGEEFCALHPPLDPEPEPEPELEA